MTETRRDRVYVPKDANTRMKKYAAECGVPLIEAYQRLIMGSIDEAGKHISPLGEAEKEVQELAKVFKMSVPETISIMVRTIKTIFNPKLPLWKALRSIPELEKEVEEE